MQGLLGFSDAEKFIIKGNYVYYNSPGNSYLNKFMSSLKLEEKFKNDDDFDEFSGKRRISKNITESIASCSAEKIGNTALYNEYNIVCDLQQNKKDKMRVSKNKQGVSKKNQIKKRNNKEKKNRLARNDNKMFRLNQYVIKSSQLLDEKELEIEDWYLCNLNVDFRDHSDDYRVCYDSDDDFEDMQRECRIEYARDNYRW